jgi:CSLREA domain-containing protein
MSAASRAVKRLYRQYHSVLRHVRRLNDRLFRAEPRKLSPYRSGSFEPLEPRLLLSGTVDWISISQHLEDAALDQWSDFDVRIEVQASLAEEVTVTTPWGEQTRLSDYMPAGWSGEWFEVDQEDGEGWLYLEVEPQGDGSYLYEFNYGFESLIPDFEARQQAVEVVPFDLSVAFPGGEVWSEELASLEDAPMPEISPELIEPAVDGQAVGVRPTLEWTAWDPGDPDAYVYTWIDSEFSDDGFYQSWPTDPPVSQWTVDHDLISGDVYQVDLGHGYSADAWAGPSTTIRYNSGRETSRTMLVDPTPGQTVDLVADLMQVSGSAGEAGGSIPGEVSVLNVGNGPAVFGWEIFLSTDGVWDASDRSIVRSGEVMEGSGGFGGAGEAPIPHDVAAGTYQMILVLDPDDLVAESDESNNILVSDPFTVTVPTNFEPIAVLDVFESDRNAAFDLHADALTVNDLDYDSDVLTVTSVSAMGTTHGTVSLDGETVRYIPDTDYTGPAQFQYTVEDGHGGSATGVVSIAVIDTPAHYVVNSLGDVVAADGVLTLREAIEAANGNVAVNEAEQGSAQRTDLITFDHAALSAEAGVTLNDPLSIVLWGTQLSITDDLHIQGLGQEMLSIDADGLSRVMYIDEYTDFTMEGVTITGGQAEEGGGIYSQDRTSDLTLNEVTITGNTAVDRGGGLCVFQTTVNLSDVTISNNVVSAASFWGGGGGIYYQGPGVMRLTGVTVSGNSVHKYHSGGRGGGGICNGGGTLIINHSSILENMVTGVTGSQDDGGGIYSDQGSLEMSFVTIAGNSATGDGGGVLTRWDDALISNCLFVNNTALIGGGIYSESNLDVRNSTIADNTADWYGGGIYQNDSEGDEAELHNNIVTMNDGWRDFDIHGRVSGSRNLVGMDAGFVDPASGDYRLLGTSIAINRADNSAALDPSGFALEQDLDGNDRNSDGTVDLGAYEYVGPPDPTREVPSTVVTTSADTEDATDGQISLREALFHAMVGDIGSTATFAPAIHGGAITLGGRALMVWDSVNVDGQSAGGVTVDAQQASSVLHLVGSDMVVSLEGVTISGGNGGVVNVGSVVLENVTIANNATYGDGGGIYNMGDLTLVNVELLNNKASTGGGIYGSYGSMTLISCTVSGNRATGTYGAGGGIYHYAHALELINSKVVGNSAARDGGGIYRGYPGWGSRLFVVSNSTVTGNSAGGEGGGFYNYSNDSVLGLNNSIVALNEQTSGSEIAGSYTDNASWLYNDPGFVRNPSHGGDGWGDDPDTTGIDESLNDDYGDLRLAYGSPAIDAGDNALVPADEHDLDGDGDAAELLAVDLQGYERIVNGTVDIGAYEFQIADLNGDGLINSQDIDHLWTNVTGTGVPPIDPKYDLDGDNDADRDDVHVLVEDHLGTRFGDTNLDKQINEADLAWLADGWKLGTGYAWASGDFTGDGQIDEADLAWLADGWKQPIGDVALASASSEPTLASMTTAGPTQPTFLLMKPRETSVADGEDTADDTRSILDEMVDVLALVG